MNIRQDIETTRRLALLLKACCLAAVAVCAAAVISRPAAVMHAARVGLTRASFVTAAAPVAPAALPLLKGASVEFLYALSNSPGVKMDHRAYAKPPLPALPRAGGKYTDAVFGTEIMRATDERDCPAPGCGTYYPHWPTFNVDNTLLLIRKGNTGDALLRRFDPDRFELIGPAEVLPLGIPGGGTPEWESSIWSHSDPSIIYTFSNYYTGGIKIYTYNVRTRRFALVKDFASLGGPKDFLHQMSLSVDDDVFAFTVRRAGEDEPVAYLAWRRSDDHLLAHSETGGIVDEVRIDKSGRYLVIAVTGTQPDNSRARILDLTTGQIEKTYWNDSDRPTGHGDLGTGFTAGFDPWGDGVNVRRFTDIHHPRLVFRFTSEDGKPDWTEEIHGSLLADNEDWITIGTFNVKNNLPDYHIFEDEIFQVALDGSARVRRICHTRSVVTNTDASNGYWAAPKPTISRDGRFIAYTSNWENSGRCDLFIAKIDPAPKLNATAAPAPTSVVRPRRAVGGDDNSTTPARAKPPARRRTGEREQR